MVRLARLTPIVVALALWPPAVALAQGAPATLHVVGHGRVFVQPDLATISIVAARSASSRQLAEGRVNRVTSAIISGLVRIGIDRASIQTSNIVFGSSTFRVGRHVHRTVYNAEIDLTVTTNRVSLLPSLFSVATRDGADSFSGPNFGFTDPSAGLLAATAAALSDARRRADAAAAQLGLRVVGVQSVDLDPGSGSTPAPAQGAPGSGGAKSSTPVLPGRLEVDTSVDVVYELGT